MLAIQPKRRPATVRTTATNDWFDYVDRVFEDFRRDMLTGMFPTVTLKDGRTEEMFLPALADIEDKGNLYEIRANLPGVRKEDIEIRLKGHFLEIDARETAEKEQKEKTFVRHERIYEGFGRVLELPEDVLGEKTAARYQDGVLTVTVPKAHPATEKHISVS